MTGAERIDIGDRVLLAIDTALGSSVALGADGRICTASSDDPRGHAEVIGELIAGVLAESGVPPERITGVVAGIGPGPFTGLRVGIAAARAFAVGRGVPLLPVPSHEAVALEALEAIEESHRADTTVRVVQDAKRRELFVTEFRGLDETGLPVVNADSHLVTRADHVAVPHEVWPERIPADRLVLLAARRLDAGRAFAPPRARYLRQPDIAQPTAPKRVST